MTIEEIFNTSYLNNNEKLICILFLELNNDNEIDISTEDIASKISVSRQAVSRTINELKNKGIITIKRRGLTLNNIYQLNDFKLPFEYVKEKPKDGFIYIMENFGLYKIGRANKKGDRFGEYTKLPYEPKYYLIEYVDDCYEIEKQLHNKFKNKQMRNNCEWFGLTNNELKEAIEYVEKYSLPCNFKPNLKIQVIA